MQLIHPHPPPRPPPNMHANTCRSDPPLPRRFSGGRLPSRPEYVGGCWSSIGGRLVIIPAGQFEVDVLDTHCRTVCAMLSRCQSVRDLTWVARVVLPFARPFLVPSAVLCVLCVCYTMPVTARSVHAVGMARLEPGYDEQQVPRPSVAPARLYIPCCPSPCRPVTGESGLEFHGIFIPSLRWSAWTR